MVILNAMMAIIYNQIYQTSFHNGMKARVAVCSLIYRKALRLSQSAVGETSPGKIVNLLSNDVNRFDWTSYYVNYLWIGPFATVSVAGLMWLEISFIGLFGILVVFMTVPLLGNFIIINIYQKPKLEHLVSYIFSFFR